MKVIAAVVTYNRCALLSRCLDRLRAQSRPLDGLVVINNDSTDGTAAMLQEREIKTITQPNVGSAGGWNRAIEHACAEGFDVVWLMDDDGFPHKDALSELLDAWDSATVCASSIVVREDEPGKFVFPFPVLNRKGHPVLLAAKRKIGTTAELDSRSPNGRYPFVHLFNGALISLAAVRAIGNVDRGYYMFGDEVDYFYRMRGFGNVYSVLAAKHFHPDVSRRSYSAEKVNRYVRNTIFLNRRYTNQVAIRNLAAIVIVLVRVLRRNGIREMLSYLGGARSARFVSSIVSGWTQDLEKSFDG